MLNKARSAIEAGNRVLGYMSGFGILALGAILFYEVIVRYFFNSPTVWAQEVAVYIFMWSMLTGASYTLMLGKHVRIDLLFDHFPPKVQLVFDILTSVAGIVFCSIVTYQAYGMISSSFKYAKTSATMLRVPMWLIQMPLLLGFALLTLQFFVIILDRAAALKNDKKEVA